jgi:type IV pilus assembly protein PilF
MMRPVPVVLAGLLLVGCAAGSGGAGSASSPSGEAGRAHASAKVHTELAGMYYSQGVYAVALEEVALAMRAEADYAPAYNMRALVHMALGEDKDAQQDFERSLRYDAKDSETRNNYGWFLCQHGREKESIEQFMEAVKNPLYSTPEKAYLNAGICIHRMGDSRAAQTYYQRALAAHPNMPQVYYQMAVLAFDDKDYAGARSSMMRFERASVDPLNAEALWLGYRISQQLGDRDSADSYALQLRRRYPDARETQLMLYGK